MGSNKKSLGNDDKSKPAQFQTLQERHQWHINKLELILRAVDNDALDLTDLAIVRESVELYVEGHMDPDCYHDENLYDCFDLDQFESKNQAPRSPSLVAQECSTPSSSKEEPTKKTSRDK